MHLRKLYPLPLLWAFCILLYPSPSYPAVLDEKIAKSYRESDYVAAAALLEQQLENLKEEALKKGRSEYTEIYRNYILLAHIYAWRLDRPEVALAKYQELNSLRQSLEGIDKIPPFEFFYIAEIYEKQKNYTKAKESYLVMLKELTAQQETKQEKGVKSALDSFPFHLNHLFESRADLTPLHYSGVWVVATGER